MRADVRLIPVGAATSAMLHVGVLVALLPALMPQRARVSQLAIEVTLDAPAQPTEGPAPGSAMAIAEQAARNLPPGLASPEQTASERAAADAAAAPPPAPREPDVAQLLASSEPPPQVSARDFGRSAPALGAEPRLEDSLPTVQAPPRLTGRDFAMTAPPAVPKSPAIDERVQATPPPQPIRQAKPKRASQQQPVEDSDGRARHNPSPVNHAAGEFSDRRAQQDYLWQIVRRLSQGRFYESSSRSNEQGVVVARITIARDGRLIDAAVARSSGFANLDRSVIDTVRRASPFPPFPADSAVDSATFIVPINYTQDR